MPGGSSSYTAILHHITLPEIIYERSTALMAAWECLALGVLFRLVRRAHGVRGGVRKPGGDPDVKSVLYVASQPIMEPHLKGLTPIYIYSSVLPLFISL